MEQETLRSRVAQLIQKSRKAVRLYSGMEKISDGEYSEYTAVQLEQWQLINTELLRSLSAAFDHPNMKLLGLELFTIRDRFCADWRAAERELKVKQRELITASEKGDFVRSAVLSRSLVALKAREQAAQAVHHELQEVIGKSKLVNTSVNEGLSQDIEISNEPPMPAQNHEDDQRKSHVQPKVAKVIQLRTRQG